MTAMIADTTNAVSKPVSMSLLVLSTGLLVRPLKGCELGQYRGLWDLVEKGQIAAGPLCLLGALSGFPMFLIWSMARGH